MEITIRAVPQTMYFAFLRFPFTHWFRAHYDLGAFSRGKQFQYQASKEIKSGSCACGAKFRHTSTENGTNSELD